MAILTLQPDETTGLDTFLRKGQPVTNQNGDGNIGVGEDNVGGDLVDRGLIQFDLSSIPADSVINSAVLTLTYSFAGNTDATNNRTMRVYRMLRAWEETTCTWNTYDGTNNWGTAGASNTTTDREASDIGSVACATTDAQFATKDVTLTASAIQEMITGGAFTNNGFLLQMDTETDDLYLFCTSNNATASRRPKLVVDYTPPASALDKGHFYFM